MMTMLRMAMMSVCLTFKAKRMREIRRRRTSPNDVPDLEDNLELAENELKDRDDLGSIIVKKILRAHACMVLQQILSCHVADQQQYGAERY